MCPSDTTLKLCDGLNCLGLRRVHVFVCVEFVNVLLELDTTSLVCCMVVVFFLLLNKNLFKKKIKDIYFVWLFNTDCELTRVMHRNDLNFLLTLCSGETVTCSGSVYVAIVVSSERGFVCIVVVVSWAKGCIPRTPHPPPPPQPLPPPSFYSASINHLHSEPEERGALCCL